MPFPDFVISAGVFVCRFAINEADGALSAIRIIDVFYLAKEALNGAPDVIPVVEGYVCAFIKTIPNHKEEHALQFKFVRTNGEVNELGEPFHISLAGKIPDAPGGFTGNLQLNLGVKNFGTCYVVMFLDGQEIARTPITLLPTPESEKPA